MTAAVPKRVARSEEALLRVARALVGEGGVVEASPVLRDSIPLPETIGPTAVELLEETLRVGAVRVLARKGGWRRENRLRVPEVGGAPEPTAETRLWQLGPAPRIRFGTRTFEMLAAAVRQPCEAPEGASVRRRRLRETLWTGGPGRGAVAEREPGIEAAAVAAASGRSGSGPGHARRHPASGFEGVWGADGNRSTPVSDGADSGRAHDSRHEPCDGDALVGVLLLELLERSRLGLPHDLPDPGFLAWLAFGDRLALAGRRPPRPEIWPDALRRSSVLVEGLVDALVDGRVRAEREKARISTCAGMERVGGAEATVLGGFLGACDALGRRDLATFLVRAGARLLEDPPDVADTVAGLGTDVALAERRSAFRAAGAFLRALGRIGEWDREHRTVRFFEDEHAAAQLLVQAWGSVGPDGFAGLARRERVLSERLGSE